MSADIIVRKRLIISGKVQGCGFRRRIRDMADLVGVAGWVWNNQNDSEEETKAV